MFIYIYIYIYIYICVYTYIYIINKNNYKEGHIRPQQPQLLTPQIIPG